MTGNMFSSNLGVVSTLSIKDCPAVYAANNTWSDNNSDGHYTALLLDLETSERSQVFRTL